MRIHVNAPVCAIVAPEEKAAAPILVTLNLCVSSSYGAALSALHLDPEASVFNIRFTRATRLTIATTSLIAAICKELSDFPLTTLPLLPTGASAHQVLLNLGIRARNTMTSTVPAH